MKDYLTITCPNCRAVVTPDEISAVEVDWYIRAAFVCPSCEMAVTLQRSTRDTRTKAARAERAARELVQRENEQLIALARMNG